MIKRFEQIVLYITLFSLCSQFGKHFWPSFSYISGIRIDYLSPTLYGSDILIGVLCILFVIRHVQQRVLNNISVSRSFVLTGILVLLLPLFFAHSKQAHIYGIVKLSEFLFMGFYIAHTVVLTPSVIKRLLASFLIGGVITSLIGISQYIVQHSLGGPLYFLGERSFNASTVGIALAHVKNTTVLRPYATFPHPNVFAFYLVVINLFVLCLFSVVQKKFWLILVILALTITHLALLLTLSRVTILMYAVVLAVFFTRLFIHSFYKLFFVLGGALIVCVLYISLFGQRYFDLLTTNRDIIVRLELLEIAANVFINNFFLGIGLNNFFYQEVLYQKTISPSFLQPVHNIYALILVQTGVVGGVLAFIFLSKTLKRVWEQMQTARLKHERNYYRFVFYALLVSLGIGFTDHFLLTLQQGQLLFAFLLGAAWIKTKKQ